MVIFHENWSSRTSHIVHATLRQICRWKLPRVGKIRNEISKNRKGSINLHRLDLSTLTTNLAFPFFPYPGWHKPRVQRSCPVWVSKPSQPFSRLLWQQLELFSELVISFWASDLNASVFSTSSWKTFFIFLCHLFPDCYILFYQ